MAEKNMWKQAELTCKPLDSYDEIATFIENPPPWRSLCKEITPHSEKVIKNVDINQFLGETLLETPYTFCHYSPETDELLKRYDRKKLPKTLVCHDMANGYHDDSVFDGTGNHEAYTFYNWGAIDIFCYFSHHLITIPPLGWINVGHAHGVKVIGTVITEWAEGVALWDRVLRSEDEWQLFASALVAIAKTLKFDGWLLNVENKISKPEALLEFVRYLHETLHRELPDPVLVWYDSVTVDGHLNWQNGLNDKNKKFFDVVDGFFTNYSWCEDDISNSVEAAGARLTDLYIGMDVWGRNFYGGGQFNLQEAIQIAHRHGCSLAIFAPAWTHEAMAQERGSANYVAEAEELDRYEHFLLRERALWGSVWPYLCTKLPSALPFQTSFCRGQGKKRRSYGEVICPVPWYNLRHMQYQPNSSHGPHGYVLSTIENIKHLSRLGLLKNKAGILRYRRSIEASKIDVLSGKSKEVALTIRADSLTVLEQEEVQEVGSSSKKPEEVKTIRTRMQNAFKYLLNMRSSKTENDASLGARNEAAGSSKNQLSGRSMLQMSVNLRLGNKTDLTRFALGYVPNELECLEPFFEDSFMGGSCLKVNPSDAVSPEHRLARIFHCDFPCESSLIACVVTKKLVGHESQFLNIKLYIQYADESQTKVVLIGRSVPQSQEQSLSTETINVYPIDQESNPLFEELQKYMLLNEPSFYVPVGNAFDWKVRYYAVEAAGARVTSVACRAGLPAGPILLGHFGLCRRH